MTTDITELAQRMKAAAVRAKAATEDYVAHRMSITVCLEECKEFNDLSDGPDNILALVEALEKAQNENELARGQLLIAHRTLLNQQQSIADLVTGRQNLQQTMGVYVHAYEEAKGQVAKDVEIKARLCRESNSLFDRLRAAEKCIAELESRTVKLPKPHAHLIWLQAGHAPDDYWDDVAVSHSEKDRCCDGSERYPVYARWEIEEMLTAAGIKWESA